MIFFQYNQRMTFNLLERYFLEEYLFPYEHDSLHMMNVNLRFLDDIYFSNYERDIQIFLVILLTFSYILPEGHDTEYRLDDDGILCMVG